MRILRSKSSVGKQEIKQDGMLCEPERFTKGTARNLTTLDIIGLVASIMFLQGLSHAMLIALDNPNEKDNDA